MALTGTEILQVTGSDNLGRPSGTTEAISTLAFSTYALSGQVPHFYFSYSVTIAAGNNQATATPITSDLAIVAVVGVGQGVVLPQAVGGAQALVVNVGLNNLFVYPAGTNTINLFAPGAPFVVPPGLAVELLGSSTAGWNGNIGNVPPAFAYNTNTAIGSTILTGANMVGNIGFQDVTLALTGALTGGATATLPSIANLFAVINNPFVGQAWRLRVINESSNAQVWTVAAPAGWSLGGTMTINQNTWRDFYVTLTAAASAGLQNIGTGTYS